MTNYVIITKSGKPWYPDNTGRFTFYSILEDIYKEYQSSGAGGDSPNLLIKNGKIIVADKLAYLAWDYGKELDQQVQNAKTVIQRKFKEPE